MRDAFDIIGFFVFIFFIFPILISIPASNFGLLLHHLFFFFFAFGLDGYKESGNAGKEEKKVDTNTTSWNSELTSSYVFILFYFLFFIFHFILFYFIFFSKFFDSIHFFILLFSGWILQQLLLFIDLIPTDSI